MTRSAKVLCLAILCLASVANAGPRDWFAWTGEVNNDWTNPLNWRWANSINMPSGVTAFGNPTSFNMVLTTRHEDGRATNPATPQTANISDGATYAPSYGGWSPELDSGMTLNITNGSTLTVASMGGNGLGTDPLADLNNTDGDNAATWQGNFLQSNVRVTGGGTFNAGGFSSATTATGTRGGLTYRYMGNLGVYVDGRAHVAVNGNYTIGATGTTGTGYGGGHFTLKGYDPTTTVSITGTLEARSAIDNLIVESLAGGVSCGSSAARFEVILDASNQGGLFNTANVGTLMIRNPFLTAATGGLAPGTMTAAVHLNVTLSGYTPVAGQIFQIIDAGSLSDGVTAGQIGAIDKGWETPFTVGSTQFIAHSTGVNGDGLYLEVVPEPATMSLLVLGGLGILARRRRR